VSAAKKSGPKSRLRAAVANTEAAERWELRLYTAGQTPGPWSPLRT
jgi:hypothetical protein